MNFKSASRESTRMFKSNFLESLSKVHWTVPPLIFVPVIAYFVWRSFVVFQLTPLMFLACLLGGLAIWTLTEYVLHRFIFHWVPDSSWGKRIHFIFHGVHHDYPQDALRLVMPPSVSIPLALLFYGLFYLLMPVPYLTAFFPGFLIGYLFYDLTHYATHHANFKSGFFKKMKHHHMTHHYTDATRGYGVSSDVWDKVFRSDFLKKQ
jgi:sterol desaturase/sphingolipid hydroxylase (fatty acid hydroxylase superfamily)